MDEDPIWLGKLMRVRSYHYLCRASRAKDALLLIAVGADTRGLSHQTSVARQTDPDSQEGCLPGRNSLWKVVVHVHGGSLRPHRPTHVPFAFSVEDNGVQLGGQQTRSQAGPFHVAVFLGVYTCTVNVLNS